MATPPQPTDRSAPKAKHAHGPYHDPEHIVREVNHFCTSLSYIKHGLLYTGTATPPTHIRYKNSSRSAYLMHFALCVIVNHAASRVAATTAHVNAINPLISTACQPQRQQERRQAPPLPLNPKSIPYHPPCRSDLNASKPSILHSLPRCNKSLNSQRPAVSNRSSSLYTLSGH